MIPHPFFSKLTVQPVEVHQLRLIWGLLYMPSLEYYWIVIIYIYNSDRQGLDFLLLFSLQSFNPSHLSLRRCGVQKTFWTLQPGFFHWTQYDLRAIWMQCQCCTNTFSVPTYCQRIAPHGNVEFHWFGWKHFLMVKGRAVWGLIHTVWNPKKMFNNFKCFVVINYLVTCIFLFTGGLGSVNFEEIFLRCCLSTWSRFES